MGYEMGVFNKRILTDIIIEGPQIVRLIYNDDTYAIYNVVVWSTERLPEVVDLPFIGGLFSNEFASDEPAVTSKEGFLHMSQDGAIQGIGFMGFHFTKDSDLSIDGQKMNSIDEISTYLKNNL